MVDWDTSQFWILFCTLILSVVVTILKIGNWAGTVSIHLSSLENLTRDFREDIKKLFERTNPSPVAWLSPIQLTEYGQKISKTENVPMCAREQASNLVEDASGKEEFEVYDLCVEYVSKQFASNSEFSRTVRSGAYQLGVEPEVVLKVYNVVLRDEVINRLR